MVSGWPWSRPRAESDPLAWEQRVKADMAASAPGVATAGTEHLAAPREETVAEYLDRTRAAPAAQDEAPGTTPAPLPDGVLGYVVTVTALKGPGRRPERAGVASADLIRCPEEAEAIARAYRALPPDSERRIYGWEAAVCEVREAGR